MKKLSNEELLAELEVPFPVDQVLWRVTNTANKRTRGQVVPYADSRAYTDRLNALVSPQNWTQLRDGHDEQHHAYQTQHRDRYRQDPRDLQGDHRRTRNTLRNWRRVGRRR